MGGMEFAAVEVLPRRLALRHRRRPPVLGQRHHRHHPGRAMNQYTRLTTAQAADIRASYRAAIIISQERRKARQRQKDLEQALLAMLWGPESSREIAALVIRPSSRPGAA